jgi:hypothetical protein
MIPKRVIDNASGTDLVKLLSNTPDIDNTPRDGARYNPISSDWAYDHVAAADPHTGYLKESDIDDTPVDGETAAPISSNWAHDHADSTSAHGIIYNNTNTYVGDSTANRAIAHGLGRIPGIIHIVDSTAWSEWFYNLSGWGVIFFDTIIAKGGYAVTAADATNFYVGNAASYVNTANLTGNNYIWFAL